MKFVSTNACFSKGLAVCGSFALILIFAFPVNASAHKSSAQSVSKSTSSKMDRDYVAALATANRFLYAWQAQDQENAIVMLTNNAKRGTSEERLRAFFSPGVEVQQSYQISHGRKITSGRYSFPVGLFVSDPAKHAGSPSAHYSEIVVVKTKDDWAVDKLP